jgi:monoamine oxidase
LSTSRRDLLKLGALATAGAAASLGAPKSAEGSRSQFVIDVAVVGAGYAGLAAAYALRRQNKSVIVLEARNRVGGRIWTTQLSDSTHIDLGGGWLSSKQPRMLKLASTFGITTFPSYTTGDNTYVRPDGTVVPYSGLIPPTADPDAADELALAIGIINAAAALLNPLAPWQGTAFLSASIIRQMDSITIEDWMESEDSPLLSSEARSCFRSVVRGAFGLEANAVSFLHLLWESALGGGFDMLLSDGPGGAEELHVTGGAGSIAKEIARRLGSAVHLNSPVREIERSSVGVTVRCESTVVTAKRAIVTIPTWLMNGIRFIPPLPPDRAQLQQRFPSGSVWKIWFVYDRAFWRDNGRTGESLDPRPSAYMGQTLDAGLAAGTDTPGLLAGFISADQARKFATFSAARRKQIVLDELVLRFGSQAATLSSTITPNYVETNWAEEEWTRGCFAAFPGPGVYTAQGFGPAIRRPVGRIHWAGVDTATDWYGGMEGAVQSGQRAAAEVLAAGL